jgi:subtilisin-like proprotein convertase family protein
VTVYLTDTSNYSLPLDFDLWSEPLRPTDYLPGDSFPGAPAGPYSPTTFASFRGMPAEGDWSLYIYDDVDGNEGSIGGGWSMLMTVLPGPSISPIPDRSISSGLDVTPIPFTVADPDTPLDDLLITAESSDLVLVPQQNMVLGGSGKDRTLTVSPAPGELGTAAITLTVSDGKAAASSSFFLTVTQALTVTLGPSISPIPDQSISSGLDLPPIPFTVADPDTPLDDLRITAQSSDLVLVPQENMVLGGSGKDRTLTVSPAPGELGTATITLTVSDGKAAASSSFFLTVTQALTDTLIFVDTSPIVIPGFGPADLYPSRITVDGVYGTIKKLAVTLRGVQHTYPADMDMILVGPQGQKIVLFSDAGKGGFPISDVTVTFSDDASKPLPAEGRILTGTYTPTNYEPGERGELDSFPEVPDGPISTHLSVYNNSSPNGTWSLYVMDDGPGDAGAINGGWSLQISVSQVALTSITRLENGFARLQGQGEAATVYRIQVSEDLANWQDLGTTSAGATGAFEFDDPNALGRSARFYRAAMPGPSSP